MQACASSLFPELRQLLLTWKLRSPFTEREDYVIVTGSRGPVQQRNAQRVFAKAKEVAGLDSLEGRLSWHSLRHSAGSTECGLAVTPKLRCYRRGRGAAPTGVQHACNSEVSGFE